MCTHLTASTDLLQIVLRVGSENLPSLQVAEKAASRRIGAFDEPEGRVIHFAVDLPTSGDRDR
ncbi:MAG: hypothetical protein ACKV2U_11390 [Bryobacteraceae bacterium]